MLRRWEVLLYNMVLTTELINKCKLAQSKEFLRLTLPNCHACPIGHRRIVEQITGSYSGN